jgi:hypothetical protein
MFHVFFLHGKYPQLCSAPLQSQNGTIILFSTFCLDLDLHAFMQAAADNIGGSTA